MVTIHAIQGRTIPLGREGENLARQIVFDISAWREAYGQGTVSLITKQHGDAEPYPCNITVDGDTVTWPITSADTACPDYGHCELRYSVGDVLVKSEMWRTFVADALGTPKPEPPEPQKAWVDKVLAAGQAAMDASVSPPKIGGNGDWWVWDFDAGKYVDTGVAASGGGDGGIVRIELADYGLNFGGEGISVPQEFVDILRDALVSRKAPYVHGALAEGMEGTVLLDTMYVMNGSIIATGVGVLVLEGVTPAWFVIAVYPETLTASVLWGILEGEDGYSPTIAVSRGEHKTILTITDVNGTKTVDIPDGKDGAVSSVNGRTGDVRLTAGDIDAIPSPATATVGQIVRVKAVDDAGKPTEWEAADMAAGGGSEWEEVANVTLSEEAAAIEFDFADAPLKLFRVNMYVPGGIGNTFLNIFTNTDTYLGKSYNIMQSNGNFGNSNKDFPRIFIGEVFYSNGNICSQVKHSVKGNSISSNVAFCFPSFSGGLPAKNIKIAYNLTTNTFPAGTVVTIEGVR